MIRIRVYETASGETVYALVDNFGWRPGTFATLEAAEAAAKRCDHVLRWLQGRAVAAGGRISMDELRAAPMACDACGRGAR